MIPVIFFDGRNVITLIKCPQLNTNNDGVNIAGSPQFVRICALLLLLCAIMVLSKIINSVRKNG